MNYFCVSNFASKVTSVHFFGLILYVHTLLGMYNCTTQTSMNFTCYYTLETKTSVY